MILKKLQRELASLLNIETGGFSENRYTQRPYMRPQGNAFRITVLLCGNPQVTADLSSRRANNTEIRCFLCCKPKQAVDLTITLPLFSDAMTLMLRHCNVWREKGPLSNYTQYITLFELSVVQYDYHRTLMCPLSRKHNSFLVWIMLLR